MSNPFLYPPAPHARRHGPQGYADYTSYLPWLRDEFSFRCVYCLLREQWGRVRGVYAIDHFLPVAHHPARVTDYDNLLYACASCNAAKGPGRARPAGRATGRRRSGGRASDELRHRGGVAMSPPALGTDKVRS